MYTQKLTKFGVQKHQIPVHKTAHSPGGEKVRREKKYYVGFRGEIRGKIGVPAVRGPFNKCIFRWRKNTPPCGFFLKGSQIRADRRVPPGFPEFPDTEIPGPGPPRDPEISPEICTRPRVPTRAQETRVSTCLAAAQHCQRSAIHFIHLNNLKSHFLHCTFSTYNMYNY